MKDRKEPSFFSGFGVGDSRKRKNHAEVASEALQAFVEAQNKMQSAISEIESDIADDQSEIEKLQRQVQSSSDSKAHLERVASRFNELLS